MSKSVGEIAFETVTALIAERGLKPHDACVAAGLSEATLRMNKSGALSLPTIEAFAQSLDVPIARLIGQEAQADPAIRRISFLRIQPSKLNPRKTFDDASIAELAESIAVQGLLQNLVVREIGENVYELVAGERRYRALEKLYLDNRHPADMFVPGIACRVVQATDAEHVALAILENLQRQDVNPMEEAEALARLHALDPVKYDTAEIARMIGMSTRHVQLRLALVNKLSPTAQNALRGGMITLAQARAMTGAPEKLQAAIVKNPDTYATAAAVKQAASAHRFPLDRAIFDTADPGIARYIDEDETGAKFFNDRDLFLKLQRAECERRLVRAKSRFAWAEIREYFYRPNYKDKLAEPIETGGCVIYLDHVGGVTVHEGLIRRDQSAAVDAATQKRKMEIGSALRRERETAVEAFRAALVPRLNAADAARLLLFASLDNAPGSCVLDLFHLDAPVDLAFGDLAPLTEFLPADANKNSFYLSDPKDAPRVWQEIGTLDDAAVGRCLARVIGPIVQVPSDYALHPVVAALATREGIAVPPLLLLDWHGMQDEITRRAALPDDQLDLEDAVRKAAAE